ncbi:hypothetical protein [Hamadaea tsunoensis]|uniref:hypothetical protein n=1 Tax=Hamadaea tsunoensis TaxID=53368 RepID=UPI00041201E1|nr:hypothetical protein [Hamadaea tsunoensis]
MRLRLALVTAVALAATVLIGPTAAHAVEYVTNGTFSAGISGWNAPTNGGAESCCAGAPNGYPEGYAHPDNTGYGSGLTSYIVTWQNITLPAGTFTLSGRIRTSGGVQSAFLQVDNGLFDQRWCQTTATNTTAWTLYSCSFTVPAGATTHVAFAALNLSPQAWGWIAFDDISVSGGGGGGETSPYDLATYLTRTDGQNGPVYSFSSGETMQIQYNSSLGRYYQVKNSQWEEIAYTADRIRRYRDTSSGGGTWYALYNTANTALGDDWIQRSVAVGTTFSRSPYVRAYLSKTTCAADTAHSGVAGTRIVVIGFNASWTSPGTSFTISNVIQLQSQVNQGGTWVHWEDYYYGKNIGLVRFVAYDPGQAGAPQVGEGHITGWTTATLNRESICG